MLFNSEKIQESFAYNKRGKLLKDRDEVIWSIFQYLDYILQFKEAIVLTILEEKQYKTPLGKHREINPHSAETERKTDFTEFYNLTYSYVTDCISINLNYNKSFYKDGNLKPNESLSFLIKIIPFTELGANNLGSLLRN